MASKTQGQRAKPRRIGDAHGIEAPFCGISYSLAARGHMRREQQGNTLQTTALVNEVYLRLVDVGGVDWKDRVPGANTGTVPSKTLRETALSLSGIRSRDLYGVDLRCAAK